MKKFFVKHKILTGIVGIILLTIIVGALGDEEVKSEVKANQIAAAQTASAPADSAAQTNAAPADSVAAAQTNAAPTAANPAADLAADPAPATIAAPTPAAAAPINIPSPSSAQPQPIVSSPKIIGFSGWIHTNSYNQNLGNSEYLNLGENFTLPKTTNVIMSDRSIKSVTISWVPSIVDSSQLGNKNYVGSVNGYDESIYFSIDVLINPVITYSQSDNSILVDQLLILPYFDYSFRITNKTNQQFINAELYVSFLDKNGTSMSVVNIQKLSILNPGESRVIRTTNIFLKGKIDKYQDVKQVRFRLQ